jgi:hypothetical protein
VSKWEGMLHARHRHWTGAHLSALRGHKQRRMRLLVGFGALGVVRRALHQRIQVLCDTWQRVYPYLADVPVPRLRHRFRPKRRHVPGKLALVLHCCGAWHMLCQRLAAALAAAALATALATAALAAALATAIAAAALATTLAAAALAAAAHATALQWHHLQRPVLRVGSARRRIGHGYSADGQHPNKLHECRAQHVHLA